MIIIHLIDEYSSIFTKKGTYNDGLVKSSISDDRVKRFRCTEKRINTKE